MLGQIKATGKAITAILLVGGFGQSAYLRDQIRNAVRDIQVMQSPNGYVVFLVRQLHSCTDSLQLDCGSSRCTHERLGFDLAELRNCESQRTVSSKALRYHI